MLSIVREEKEKKKEAGNLVIGELILINGILDGNNFNGILDGNNFNGILDGNNFNDIIR
jgi:hypothetical protein